MVRERLSGRVELMDLPGADPEEVARALGDLARINRFLGGEKLVEEYLPRLLPGLPSPIRVLDVATGSADLARVIARWARAMDLGVEIVALDHDPTILDVAARACEAYPEICLELGDALSIPHPEGSFDLVLASQVLHHMEGEEPIRLLSELRRVARQAVLVSDLRRGRWPFLVTWAFLHAVSRNRFIRHDGPLSIRRAYVEEELLRLAHRAGYRRAKVRRHAFFRLALVELMR